jgi:cold shock CspA family protein
MQGIIDRLAPDRGFGFLISDRKEFFFHRSGLKGVRFEDLAPGTVVDFEVQADAEGDRPREHPRAVSITLADQSLPGVDNDQLPRGKVA